MRYGHKPELAGFGDRLRAVGFDPNLAEVERLRQSEPLPGVTYFAGFVGAAPTDPFVINKGGAPEVSRNPWHRLAVEAILERRRTTALSNAERTELNLWGETELADAAATIVLPESPIIQGLEAIDFVKIDVDGKDFEVLHSLASLIDQKQILGFGLEINYIGTSNDTDHTFLTLIGLCAAEISTCSGSRYAIMQTVGSLGNPSSITPRKMGLVSPCKEMPFI